MSRTALTVVHTDHDVTLHLHGEIDLAVLPELTARGDPAVQAADRVIVNLADVSFIDVTGLGLLVRWRNLAGQQTATQEPPFKEPPFKQRAHSASSTRPDNPAGCSKWRG